MKKIILPRGKVVLIDDEDFEKIKKYKWHFALGYAKTNIPGKKSPQLMHRIILNAPVGMDVDHINGNGLDNRKKNIRICTHSQNLFNQGKYKNNTSGLKGVSIHRNKWIAKISVKGKRIELGYFKTKELAYKAYCIACKKYHGEYSHL